MKLIRNFAGFLIGVFGLYLFIDHMLGFKPNNCFYAANPSIKKYIGTNIVSMYADLSFFTYHTLIFFSAWMMLFTFSDTLGIKKLSSFLRKDTVTTFISLNYIVTALIYTVFEISSGNPTFGLYARTPAAYHNFGTNITIHYIYFTISMVVFLKTKVLKNRYGGYFKASLIPLSYLIVYYVSVLITGLFCYRIIWFPYPIFDPDEFSRLIGIQNEDMFIKVSVLVAVLALMALIYQLLFVTISKIKGRKGIYDI